MLAVFWTVFGQANDYLGAYVMKFVLLVMLSVFWDMQKRANGCLGAFVMEPFTQWFRHVRICDVAIYPMILPCQDLWWSHLPNDFAMSGFVMEPFTQWFRHVRICDGAIYPMFKPIHDLWWPCSKQSDDFQFMHLILFLQYVGNLFSIIFMLPTFFSCMCDRQSFILVFVFMWLVCCYAKSRTTSAHKPRIARQDKLRQL